MNSDISVTAQPPSSVSEGGCAVTEAFEFPVKPFGHCVPDDHDVVDRCWVHFSSGWFYVAVEYKSVRIGGVC